MHVNKNDITNKKSQFIYDINLIYRGQKGRTVDTPTFDPAQGNPFSERPSTARQNDAAHQALEVALQELDRETNAPEGVEPPVWDRMCSYRRQKIESEQLVSNS